MSETTRAFRKTRVGTVISDKMDKTIGDTVKVMECRPLSKDKRWRLVEIVEKAK